MPWNAEANRMPTDATTYNFVTAVYSSKVINHVRSNLVAVATCNTTWREQLAKGYVVYIPVMRTQTAVDVDPHVSFLGVADARGFGTTNASIEVAYWKENPVLIDDSTALQTNVPDLLNIAADNASYGLLEAIDTTVNGLYNTTTATWRGSDGQTFDDDLLISLMEGLDEANVPRAGRSLIGDPSMVADIYKIDKFMSYDYNQTTFTTDAFRGKINAYNLPVFVSNNLEATTTGNYGILMHPDCIGVVIQSAPKVESFRVPEQHSDCINISAFYGCAVVRSTFGAYFYTRKS